MRAVAIPTILVRPASSGDLDAVLGLLEELRWERRRDGGVEVDRVRVVEDDRHLAQAVGHDPVEPPRS